MTLGTGHKTANTNHMTMKTGHMTMYTDHMTMYIDHMTMTTDHMTVYYVVSSHGLSKVELDCHLHQLDMDASLPKNQQTQNFPQNLFHSYSS